MPRASKREDTRFKYRMDQRVRTVDANRAPVMTEETSGVVHERKVGAAGELWYRIRYDDGIVGTWQKEDDVGPVTEVRHG